MTTPLLSVHDLKKHFPVGGGLFGSGRAVRAVDGVSFDLGERQTLGLVGESGSGKSTLGRLLLRLTPPTDGQILFRGRPVHEVRGRALKEYRRQIQAVFQDPYSSLDPRMRIGETIAEPLVIAGTMPRRAIALRVAELLDLIGLNPAVARSFPHELSGGMRQRVAIARGLALDPRMVVLDEPVSALDVSIRAQILNLLQDLQDRLGVSYILISHDLPVVGRMCTTVAVMYLGRLVEIGPAAEVCKNPRHPYTRALFSAVLPTRPGGAHRRINLVGDFPSPIDPPPGCHFHTRCPLAQAVCRSCTPAAVAVGAGHSATCHFVDGSRLGVDGMAVPAPC